MRLATLSIRPVSVTEYLFKTANHTEELNALGCTFAVDKTGCNVVRDYIVPNGGTHPENVCLATSPHVMSILRDAYRGLLMKISAYDQLCPWKWEFKERCWYLPPEDATSMSLVWKDISSHIKKESEENYPINFDRDVKPDLVDGMEELLLFAGIRGCWLEIQQNVGY